MTIQAKTIKGKNAAGRLRKRAARLSIAGLFLLLFPVAALPVDAAVGTEISKLHRSAERDRLPRVHFREAIVVKIMPSDLTRHPIAREVRAAAIDANPEADLLPFLDRIRSRHQRLPITARVSTHTAPTMAGHQPLPRWGTFSAEVNQREGFDRDARIDTHRLRRWQRLRSMAPSAAEASVVWPDSHSAPIDRLLRAARAASNSDEHRISDFFD